MGRNKIRELNFKVLLKFFLPAVLIMVIIAWASNHFVQLTPPKILIMSTGREKGSFVLFGERYRQVLAQYGVKVKLLSSSGAVENLRRLQERSHRIDAGFVQDGLGKVDGPSNLVSLGSLFYTPLWVFYRSDEILDDLSQLRGKRINPGPEGSSVRKFALDLLKAVDALQPPTKIYDFSQTASQKGMMEGKIDAMMVFSPADNPFVQEMLNSKDIKLMSFSLAESYTRLFPGLSHVVLPKGIVNLKERIPTADIHLLASTVNLIVRNNLHPALVYLLLKASVEIYGGAGWLHKAGEFPSSKTQDFPIGEQADRFYKSGGSVLYNSLPFWAAAFIDRMLVIIIPLGVILIPMIGILPWLYTWKNRSKYYRWYRELRSVEEESRKNDRAEDFNDYQEHLDRIEKAVDQIKVSVPFYDEVFILKGHIQSVREKILSRNRLPKKNSDPSDLCQSPPAEKLTINKGEIEKT